jgi:hypothetical protein
VAVNEQDGRRINSVNGGVTTRPTTEKETHPKQNKNKTNIPPPTHLLCKLLCYIYKTQKLIINKLILITNVLRLLQVAKAAHDLINNSAEESETRSKA